MSDQEIGQYANMAGRSSTHTVHFTPEPCPSCGYCPHCGRGGYAPYRYYPSYPNYPNPWITWSSSTGGAL